MRVASCVCGVYLLFGWLTWAETGRLAGLAFATGTLFAWAVMAAAAAWSLGAFRWRVRVKASPYDDSVEIVARRLWTDVSLATVKGKGDHFDDKLHAAVAEAGPKVAALNAHRRLRR